jgi:hypothetical protein
MTTSMCSEDAGEQATDSFVPTKDWLDAYLKQATAELIEFAKRYAGVQSRKVKLVRHVDESYAEELVVDVLGDTLLGVIAWSPERVSLKKHVLDAIKSRTRHDYVRALKFRPVRLDEPEVMAEVELQGLVTAQTDAMVTGVCEAVIDALRDLAKGDEDVLLMLDAMLQLATKKRDVMKVTGMNHKRYDAARKRLHRLTLQLPASLRDATFGED